MCKLQLASGLGNLGTLAVTGDSRLGEASGSNEANRANWAGNVTSIAVAAAL